MQRLEEEAGPFGVELHCLSDKVIHQEVTEVVNGSKGVWEAGRLRSHVCCAHRTECQRWVDRMSTWFSPALCYTGDLTHDFGHAGQVVSYEATSSALFGNVLCTHVCVCTYVEVRLPICTDMEIGS